jgi:hypothetical protein
VNDLLERRIKSYINKIPGAVSGSNGHGITFAAACNLLRAFPNLAPHEALSFLREYNQRCEPPWTESELNHKVTDAWAEVRNGGPRIVGALASSTPEPKRQPPDCTTTDRIIQDGLRLPDLLEASFARFDDDSSHVEQIVDVIFPGNPLLCIGKTNWDFHTRRRSVWRGHLHRFPLIVPNPMLAIVAPTQDGRLSEHSKRGTGKRVYLVIEFDFRETNDKGGETVWASYIRRWKSSGISIVDACAALIMHLALRMPTLVCVCFSGGKSLHAWFRVFDVDLAKQYGFVEYAISLGADPALWKNRSQFARIPDGRRENGVRQTCYYLDPRQAVQA